MVAFFVSEVVLSRVRPSSTMEQDRNSLWVLYVTIGLSISVGVTVAMFGIGAYPISEIWRSGLCVGFLLIGAVIRWVAIRQLGKHFTVGVEVQSDHQLHQTGLYKRVRHPSYTGLMLEFIGLSFYFGSWASHLVIVLPITMALAYRIHVEERALLGGFGKEYEEYSTRTARLIPGIW
jgi:protein-S-isoprenylcysteine O-methyltransferase Ste14